MKSLSLPRTLHSKTKFSSWKNSWVRKRKRTSRSGAAAPIASSAGTVAAKDRVDLHHPDQELTNDPCRE